MSLAGIMWSWNRKYWYWQCIWNTITNTFKKYLNTYKYKCILPHVWSLDMGIITRNSPLSKSRFLLQHACLVLTYRVYFLYILATTQDNFHRQFSHKKSWLPTEKAPEWLPVVPDWPGALLEICLNTTYFCYNGIFYKQKKGVTMGTPVSPNSGKFAHGTLWRKSSQGSTSPSIRLVEIRGCYIDSATREWNRTVHTTSQLRS